MEPFRVSYHYQTGHNRQVSVKDTFVFSRALTRCAQQHLHVTQINLLLLITSETLPPQFGNLEFTLILYFEHSAVIADSEKCL